MSIKKYIYSFLVISLCFGNITCTPFEIYDVVKDIKNSPNICKDGTTYQTEFQERGIYRDEKEREFKVIVDFQSITDVFSTGQTAKDVAELAGIAMRSLENSKEPKYQFLDDVYIKALMSFHVIVTSTQEEFDYLYDGNKAPGENIIAYTMAHVFCWDDTENINFNIVIKNNYFNNMGVLSHELSHIISYYEYGDADGNHNNPDVWFPLGGFDSIQGKILWQYELETGLNAFKGGPAAP